MGQFEPLKVVLFSGGRGTTSITDALLKYPEIELTLLVNAYDDGLSTGMLRRFIPGMLGPSDIRKVVSSLLRHQTDSASQALRVVTEHRLPDPIKTGEALETLEKLIRYSSPYSVSHELIEARERLSLTQLRQIAQCLEAFLGYYRQTIKTEPWFSFADNSLGNLIFAGCYLLSNRNFNRSIERFSELAGVSGRIINVTQGEHLILMGIKQTGQVLENEASIVGPQEPGRIEEIFLLPDYLTQEAYAAYQTKAEKISFFRSLERWPKLNPQAQLLLNQADIIIYGPGTQHSSLYPSYLTIGLSEAVRANKRAEKIFIANIARDHDILSEDAGSLVAGFMHNMSRKGTHRVRSRHLVTRFFFQKPENFSGEANYLPFEAGGFGPRLEQVVWVDLEGDHGKHAGGRTVSELLAIVEKQLRQRIRHQPHKVSIIVPALNEKRTIVRVLEALKALEFPELGLEKEIIVIDGGSTDKTDELARSVANIRTYQTTGGRGAALQLGLEKAKGDIIVFFPSDGEYLPSDISRVIAPLLNQEFPVVFGSRAFRSHDLSGTLQHIYGGRGMMFMLSKYGGMLLSVLTLLIYQRYTSDPLTSLKAFNARVLRGVSFVRRGVDFDMELIAKLSRSRYHILEVPISYKARTVKQGKKITVWDGLKSVFALFQFARYQPR